MEWHDPEHPHAYYDLTKDAEALVQHRGTCVHNKVRRRLDMPALPWHGCPDSLFANFLFSRLSLRFTISILTMRATVKKMTKGAQKIEILEFHLKAEMKRRDAERSG